VLQAHGEAGFDFLMVPLAGSPESRPPDLPEGAPHVAPFYESDLSLR